MNSEQQARDGHRNVLVLQHAASENLGTIEDSLHAAGVSFHYVRTFEGQPVPQNIGAASGLIVMGGPMACTRPRAFHF
jgi:GMP synthase-like glutamine amidotransferase